MCSRNEVGEQIPVDSVQEYSIITNDFSAEYGRASGGVVNLTTKSGTNTFHGAGWEYNRLSAYTANTYQNDALKACGLPKGDYTRNQFGFLAGGPVIKDKLFFFESTEWTRVRSQANETELIPTPQFLAYTAPNVQSYFKAYGGNSYPISSVLYQSDLENSGALSEPLPGVPAGTPILGQVNFKTSADAGGDLPQNTYRLLARVDFNMTDKTSMFFRYGKQSDDLFSGTTFYSPYPQYNVGSAFKNYSTLYSISHTFGPNLFNNTKLSYNRLDNPSHLQHSVPKRARSYVPGCDRQWSANYVPGTGELHGARRRRPALRRSAKHNPSGARPIVDQRESSNALWRPIHLYTDEYCVWHLRASV